MGGSRDIRSPVSQGAQIHVSQQPNNQLHPAFCFKHTKKKLSKNTDTPKIAQLFKKLFEYSQNPWLAIIQNKPIKQ